ncbi:hypothetical protein MRB53_002988 [Persea americana]|uniref:Uncharacterized protein n=1 Tax=Persea americana TaxID=3435 RepID=A0ACC2MWD8_PERAE|nr:hypothetical protein MRB53_002988 [Persea americana]
MQHPDALRMPTVSNEESQLPPIHSVSVQITGPDITSLVPVHIAGSTTNQNAGPTTKSTIRPANSVHTSAGLAPIATSVSEVSSAPTTPSVPVHHMVTRNKDGTRKRKALSTTRHPIHALTVITSAVEPTCFILASRVRNG